MRLLDQRRPQGVHARVQLLERAVILNDVIRACALQSGRHLCGDHRVGFRGRKLTVVDEPFAPDRLGGINEDDAVHRVRKICLEEQRDVADHEWFSASAGRLGGRVTQSRDGRMDDGIQRRAFGRIGEDDATERGAIERAIAAEHGRAPAIADRGEGRPSGFHGFARENVRVDDERALLGESCRHGGLARGDVSGEADDQHT